MSVLVNGSPTKEFSVGRGLQQGDPLSPFLFLIAAKGLSIMFKEAQTLGIFSGHLFPTRGLCISHLQFADDTLLVGEISYQNVWVIKSLL